jgi:hypothetical protein
MIDKILGLPFKDPLETYSTSDHVYTGLGIPKDVTGRLAKSQRTREGLQAEQIEDLGETGRKPKPQRSGDRDQGGRSRQRRSSGGDRSTSGAKPAETTADKPRSANRRRRRTKRGGSTTAPAAE